MGKPLGNFSQPNLHPKTAAAQPSRRRDRRTLTHPRMETDGPSDSAFMLRAAMLTSSEPPARRGVAGGNGCGRPNGIGGQIRHGGPAFTNLAGAGSQKAVRLQPRKVAAPPHNAAFKPVTASAQPGGATRVKARYDANETFISIIFRWKGTLLPMVLTKPLFWVMTLVNTALLIWNDTLMYTRGEGLPVLEWEAAVVPMSLLTYFIVFYGSQSYNRYYLFYEHLTSMSGALMRYMSIVRRHFGGDRVAMWDAARLMLAAHHILFAGLDGSFEESEFDIIRKNNLLTEDEINTIAGFKGSRTLLPINWALDEVDQQLRAVRPDDDSRAAANRNVVYQDFESAVFAFLQHSSAITSLLAAPVPYPYFHVVKVMLLIALTMTGYALIHVLHGMPVFTMGCFAIICLILIGLQEIAAAMSDPFGDDEVSCAQSLTIASKRTQLAQRARRESRSAISSHISSHGLKDVPRIWHHLRLTSTRRCSSLPRSTTRYRC